MQPALRSGPTKRFIHWLLVIASVTPLFKSTLLHANTLWLLPGDLHLRSEIQSLEAVNIISQPINTWPLPLAVTPKLKEHCSQVEKALPISGPSSPKLCAIIKSRLKPSNQWQLSATARTDNPLLTDFGYIPRTETQLSLSNFIASNLGEMNLSIQFLEDPLDEHPTRLDGSFIQASLKNWRLGVGLIDRWWGPGWRNGMILSTNARPVPTIYLTGANEKSSKYWFLNWLGPWQFTQFLGRLESDRTIDSPLLWGLRFNFKPTEHLELGLSRTAIWGGEGRPDNFSTFVDLFLGKDNYSANDPNKANEPGNQLGGIDFQYSRKVFDQTLSFYGEVIGEDEAGGLPSRPVGLFGVHWSWLKADYKLNTLVEYSDSALDFWKDAIFNSAYNHGIYQSGYRYYQRALGASADNDSRQHNLGIWINFSETRQAGLWFSHLTLNRDGIFSNNPVSVTNISLNQYELWQNINWQNIDWTLRLGYLTELPENRLKVGKKSYFSIGMKYLLP